MTKTRYPTRRERLLTSADAAADGIIHELRDLLDKKDREIADLRERIRKLRANIEKMKQAQGPDAAQE